MNFINKFSYKLKFTQYDSNKSNNDNDNNNLKKNLFTIYFN